MMTAAKIFALLATLLLVAPFAAFAAEDTGKFVISDVDYNDPVAPGDAVEVTVTLANSDAKYDVEDLEVTAWIQDQFGDKVSDKAIVSGLQVQQGSDRDLTLNLEVPADAEAGDYTLIVKADGRWENIKSRVSAESVDNIIEVEQFDDAFYVSDITLSKTQYKAGDTVDVAVTVMNNGQEDQDAVAVAIAVPEFNILKSLKMFGTMYAGTEQTVYFTFALPKDATGIYTLKATASNDLAKDTSNVNIVIEAAPKIDAAKTVVTTVSKELRVGEKTDLQLSVANKGTETKAYIVSVYAEGINGVVDPASFSLAPGQAKTVDVELTALKAGTQAADITVTENGAVVSKVIVTSEVAQGMTDVAALFLALAVILALVVVYTQYKGGNGRTEKALYY